LEAIFLAVLLAAAKLRAPRAIASASILPVKHPTLGEGRRRPLAESGGFGYTSAA